MKAYNTSEILKKAHSETRMSLYNGWAKWEGKSYKEAFSFFLSKEWKKAKLNNQPVQNFTVQLNYSETKYRGWVKGLGFKWNPDRKVWTGSCQRHKLDFLPESRINPTTNNEPARRWIPANHAAPGHFAYSTGNYGMDVLSGYYEE